jgi:hypothetical protein
MGILPAMLVSCIINGSMVENSRCYFNGTCPILLDVSAVFE